MPEIPSPPPPPGYNAAIIAQTVPSEMVTGQVYPCLVAMRNTGTEAWTYADLVVLGAVNQEDNGNFLVLPAHTSEVTLSLNVTVAPDASYVFAFSVVAPSTAGTYNFQRRMKKGSEWFGDVSLNVAVGVYTELLEPPDNIELEYLGNVQIAQNTHDATEVAVNAVFGAANAQPRDPLATALLVAIETRARAVAQADETYARQVADALETRNRKAADLLETTVRSAADTNEAHIRAVADTEIRTHWAVLLDGEDDAPVNTRRIIGFERISGLEASSNFTILANRLEITTGAQQAIPFVVTVDGFEVNNAIVRGILRASKIETSSLLINGSASGAYKDNPFPSTTAASFNSGGLWSTGYGSAATQNFKKLDDGVVVSVAADVFTVPLSNPNIVDPNNDTAYGLFHGVGFQPPNTVPGYGITCGPNITDVSRIAKAGIEGNTSTYTTMCFQFSGWASDYATIWYRVTTNRVAPTDTWIAGCALGSPSVYPSGYTLLSGFSIIPICIPPGSFLQVGFNALNGNANRPNGNDIIYFGAINAIVYNF